MSGSKPIGGSISDDGEMTTVKYELMRVAKIESVQPSPHGDQVAVWFTDTNNKLVCLVMPPGVTLGVNSPTVN